ncbi:MAG: RluA family pseudouridine synthase [Chitinophagaceae bacterium]|nr:RluA family pseudouridine synthase [Chitinophagaceae bacterium]MCB9046436.1 RluA family pseudouridine synthase [Chitinophagales bacterium]
MAEETEDLWEDDIPEEDNEEAAPERVERMRFITDKGQEPLRIDKFMMHKVEHATRNKIQQALEEGHILVNGAIVKSNYKVRPGDEVILFETRSQESTEVLPEDIPLDVVYEDDDALIINKPAGMVVHPGNGNRNGTLVNALAFYLQKENIDTEGLPRVGLVHRIDKNTSGLIVIGKSEAAMTKLAAQFKKHTVHRRYIALVWGDLADDEGTIVAHVGRDQRHRKRMDAYPDGEHGKEAITHYKVLERFNYVTLVELRLETGRTHQIRVHMRYIGHPLFNDSTYGGDRIVKGTVFTRYKQFIDNCFKILQRHALHAKELGFKHPVTGEWIQYDSELPEDMTEVIEKWRTYTKGMNNQLKERMGG